MAPLLLAKKCDFSFYLWQSVKLSATLLQQYDELEDVQVAEGFFRAVVAVDYARCSWHG
jgi:hypothetical protein